MDAYRSELLRRDEPIAIQIKFLEGRLRSQQPFFGVVFHELMHVQGCSNEFFEVHPPIRVAVDLLHE